MSFEQHLRRAVASRWIVFLTTVVAHGLYARRGPLLSLDSQLYIELADRYLSGDVSGMFNTWAIRWTKVVFVSILAVARATSPEHWAAIMIGLNVVCSGAIAVLLVDLVGRAAGSTAASVAALLFYLGCWEIFSWAPYVLTDITYTFAALLVFVLVARRIVIDGEPPRPLLLTFALLLAIFMRPPGVVVALLVVFAELVLVRERIRAHLAVLLLLFAGFAALTVRTAVVHDPARWPFAFVRPKIVEFSAREKTGEVVYDRKESHRPPPKTMVDHLVIQGDRFVRFFQFTSRDYSRMHNLVNVAYFVSLYLFAIVGAIDGLRSTDRRRRSFVLALLLWIGVFAFFHALTILDYDWRFRMPLLPHMIMLAACGVDVLAVAILKKPFRAVQPAESR